MARRTTVTKMEEVTDLESEPKPPAELDLVAGLTFATFFALLVGMVLAQLVMKKYLGTGLFA
jgi:hypothetical protein